MSNNQNESHRFLAAAKGSDCPGCGFPRLACRCGGGSGSDDTEINSQKPESNESAHSKDDGAKGNSSSFSNPFALPTCTPR